MLFASNNQNKISRTGPHKQKNPVLKNYSGNPSMEGFKASAKEKLLDLVYRSLSMNPVKTLYYEIELKYIVSVMSLQPFEIFT